MSNPTTSALHINTPLTNIAVGAVQDASHFAAARVFPIVPVMKQSDIYRTFNIADMYRDDLKPRAAGTESHGTGYSVGEDSYICKRYDLHHDIADEERANADSVFALDSNSTRILTNQALIRRESMFADSYLTTGKWATEAQGVTASPTGTQFLKWTDDASDPVADVEAAKLRVLLGSGMMVNKITMTYDVRAALQTNPAIIDRIKYSGGISNDTPVNVSDQALAQVFGVDEIVVSKAIKNTAKEGAAMVGEFIASSKVLLSYAPRTPGIFEMSAGYIFSWRGLLGSVDGMRVKKFRMEALESDRIEIQTAWAMKQTSNVCGTLLYDVV